MGTDSRGPGKIHLPSDPSPSGASGTVVLLLAGLLALTASGCGDGHEFDPPDRAEQVRDAAAELDLAAFDTIGWESDSLRLLDGNEVYARECRRCHGYLGRGDTEYARRNDIDAPSLVRPGWKMADHPDSLRRRIYIGHPDGMPTWGIGRISLREIDAVAAYIRMQLRPEVLEESESAGE
jgi:mono/diheme cytochrome c family protein